jgi:hypothetical protein
VSAAVPPSDSYKALSADGNPSFATIIKVAKAVGLALRFEPAASHETVAAVAQGGRAEGGNRAAGAAKGREVHVIPGRRWPL